MEIEAEVDKQASLPKTSITPQDVLVQAVRDLFRQYDKGRRIQHPMRELRMALAKLDESQQKPLNTAVPAEKVAEDVDGESAGGFVDGYFISM